MKKVQIVFTGVYVKFNPVTKERALRYNYVVVGGDVKTFTEDKKASGFDSTQDEGEHAGKPRIAMLKDIGETAELQRILKKDGTYDWFTDETDALVEESLVNNMSSAGKAEYAKEEVRQMLINKAKLSASIRAKRESDAQIASELEAKNNKPIEKDLTKK